jgi:hypothetical protein
MDDTEGQRLIAWELAEGVGQTPSFGDFELVSPKHQELSLVLFFEEGQLRVDFHDVRAFEAQWDGDTSRFFTSDELRGRPSELLRVEGSRWLASEHFTLDIESSVQGSPKRWEHFCVLASERSLHVAARDDISSVWTPGEWEGSPGSWTFRPAD